MSQSDEEYTIFEKSELEQKIPQMYLLNGGGIENLSSRLNYASDIYKILPFDNVRKYTDGFIIKYNSSDTTFVVITNSQGGITNMFYYSQKIPDSENFKNIKKGMLYEDIKAAYPEIVLSTHLPEFLMGGGKREPAIGEIFLKNGDIGHIQFGKKDDKYYVIDSYIISRISSDVMELLNL